MPIKLGNSDIPRIYVGDSKIRRVYKGSDLIYGLYDIHYYDRSNIDTYSPKEYAWGYEPECITFPSPTNAPTYFDTYKTHWGDSNGQNGWYTDNSLNTQKSKIELTDHEDLDMYAKWLQRKYSYGGVIKYYTWEGGGGGSFTARTSINSPSFMGYDSSPYWGSNNIFATVENCLPNCTTYAYGRCLEVGIGAPVSSGPNASGWPSVANFEVVPYSYSSLEPGDLIVWERTSGGWSAGHVAFYEGDGYVSSSGYSSSNRGSTMQATSNYWYSGAGASDSHAFNYKTIDGESSWGGNGESPWKIIKSSQGLSGGGGSWQSHTQSVSKTSNNLDQNNPTFPSANSIVPAGGPNPSGQYKNSEWSSKIKYTDERQIIYPNKAAYSGWSSWAEVSSSDWLIW